MRRNFLCLLLLGAAVAAGDLTDRLAALELRRHYDETVFAKAAASDDARTRRLAARAAGRIKDARARGLLLSLIRDKVGPVRRAALFALGQMGGKDAFIGLRATFVGMDAADLPFALEALGKTRDARGVSTVTRYLTHRSADVRGEAALALFRIGDASALPDLFAAILAETDPEPRWRQIYTASRLLSAKRRAAGKRVAVSKTWIGVLQLAAKTDRPFQERVFATLGLGSIQGQVDYVLTLVAAEDPRVAIAAIRALRGEWDEELCKALQTAAGNHAHPLVREAWIRWLISMTPKDPKQDARQAQVVQVMLDGAAGGAKAWKWNRLHTIAAEAAARAGGGAAVDPEDADEELVWRVNASFPDRLPAGAPKTLRGQAAAAEVCGQKRMPRIKALRVLTGLLRIRDFTVRSTAIDSIVKRGGKHLVEHIVRAAKDSPGTENLDVRLSACNALRDMGVYHAWLNDAAVDADWPVRDAARGALAKLKKPLPAAVPREAFKLAGWDAARVVKEGATLRGARVTLETNRGNIVMVLLPDEAPVHCVNFAQLVRKKFYDGLTWHRVVADFVIQGGCPRGDGWGGPGYMLPDEIGTRPYVRGTVGMPRSGNDTGGCQIFITHLPTPHLDGHYSVYAQVVAGLDVVDRILVGDTIKRATLALAAPR